MDEVIIAVPREQILDLLNESEFGFIENNLTEYYNQIIENVVEVNRPEAEKNDQLKQIIPYILVHHKGYYFMLRRKSTQAEVRLHNKMSIGVGGHMNPTDSSDNHDMIIGGLIRELQEELVITDFQHPRLLGFINDDISEVGRVHLGLLFQVEADTLDVEVQEKDKMEGTWASFDELSKNYENMEAWSKIAYDRYIKLRN